MITTGNYSHHSLSTIKKNKKNQEKCKALIDNELAYSHSSAFTAPWPEAKPLFKQPGHRFNSRNTLFSEASAFEARRSSFRIDVARMSAHDRLWEEQRKGDPWATDGDLSLFN